MQGGTGDRDDPVPVGLDQVGFVRAGLGRIGTRVGGSTSAGVGRLIVEALEAQAVEHELQSMFAFTYVPGPQLLTYLLAWLSGQGISIAAFRVIQVIYTAVAAFMATLCCRQILRLAFERWLAILA